MKSSNPAFIKPKTAQRGAAAVEFALVAIPFFLLMFGAMEFGRLLYLWNTVQEVTRNAARQAVVADFNDPTAIELIKRSAVFRTTAGSLPAASEITDARVKIRYLNAAGAVASPMPLSPGDNIAACLDDTRVAECIRFVEVCVSTV
ncbi:MAG: TadE/TadG family type IV pilus assembly protein, partial [Polaromonas sp.]